MKEETLGDIVQKFRIFGIEIRNRRGEDDVRHWLAVERRHSYSITDPFERRMFQALITDLEVELLGKVSDESNRFKSRE
jgi:hypothetical protein